VRPARAEQRTATRRSGAAPARGARAALALAALLAGCSGGDVVAPVGRAPEQGAAAVAAGVHRVRAGETLYSIAWRYGLDYRELARWNAIREPFTIGTGQRLRISRPAVLPPMPQPSPPATARRAPKAETPPPRAAAKRAPPQRRARSAPAPRARDDAARDDGEVDAWVWPARGRIIGAFGRSGGKGIDIEGSAGAPIVAAAPGQVVYGGSGLRGYGKLIIVKHNKRYLSAYAHNERLHVKEGDTVRGGQRIADMGTTDAKSVRLHFEIRRDGKPVDPTRYLPR